MTKIGAYSHTSAQKTKEALLPQFQQLFQTDSRFVCKMMGKLNLSESEVKFLLGNKHAHKMKDILQCIENVDEQQEEIPFISEEKIEKNEEKKEQKDDLKQPSIFDF